MQKKHSKHTGLKTLAKDNDMNLNEAELGTEYVITDIDTNGDEEMESFLFSLGCYSGEVITVVDKRKNLFVSIKDARYNIDPELAASILVKPGA